MTNEAVAAGRLQWRQVDWQSGHRDRYACLDLLGQAALERAPQVQIGGLGVDVAEPRPGADEQCAVGRGDKAKRGREQLIARAEAGRVGRGVQCGGSVSESDRVAGAEVLAERVLKRLHTRPLSDERVRQGAAHRRDVRLVDRLAAVGEEVRHGALRLWRESAKVRFGRKAGR